MLDLALRSQGQPCSAASTALGRVAGTGASLLRQVLEPPQGGSSVFNLLVCEHVSSLLSG